VLVYELDALAAREDFLLALGPAMSEDGDEYAPFYPASYHRGPGHKFSVGLGIDPTPAPALDASIGAAIERFTGHRFGSSGTLTAARLITEAVKSVPAKQVGYSGLMVPVLEDRRLAQRWSEGRSAPATSRRSPTSGASRSRRGCCRSRARVRANAPRSTTRPSRTRCCSRCRETRDAPYCVTLSDPTIVGWKLQW